MEEQQKLRTKAVLIIQRNFRKYLKDRKSKHTSYVKNNKHLDEATSSSDNIEINLLTVQRELASFYKDDFVNTKREELINESIFLTESIIEKLKTLKCLDDLAQYQIENATANPANLNISKEAERRHNEKLEQFYRQWWEKLNYFSDVI